jgi:hypothetical protein
MRLPVCPSSLNKSAPNEGILLILYIVVLLENRSRIFKLHSRLPKMRGNLYKDQCKCGPGSSVGIETDYGLGGQGIDLYLGRIGYKN